MVDNTTPLPRVVTVKANHCSCATPSLKQGEQMSTELNDYVLGLIADGCVVVVEHPPGVARLIASGGAYDATADAGGIP